jgi:hypothetical protein
MRPNGTLRVSESQYLSGYEQARDYAQALGRSFSPQQYGFALKNGNSASEIRLKLEAVDKMRTYAPFYQQVSDYLQATGVTKKPPTKAQLLEFALGKGDKVWYDTVRTATAAMQIEAIGLSVGKPIEGADIGYKGLSKIAREIEVLGQQGDYTGVLAQATKVLNEGDWKAAGLTGKDKVKLALGSRDASGVAERLSAVVNARVASLTEQRANPSLQQGPLGGSQMPGANRIQATE